MMDITIPLSFMADLVIKPHPYDPYSLMIVVPPECAGKLMLPRQMFSAEINGMVPPLPTRNE